MTTGMMDLRVTEGASLVVLLPGESALMTPTSLGT